MRSGTGTSGVKYSVAAVVLRRANCRSVWSEMGVARTLIAARACCRCIGKQRLTCICIHASGWRKRAPEPIATVDDGITKRCRCGGRRHIGVNKGTALRHETVTGNADAAFQNTARKMEIRAGRRACVLDHGACSSASGRDRHPRGGAVSRIKRRDMGRCTGRYCGAMQRGVHANAAIGDGLADDDVRKEGRQCSDQRAESAERVPRMRRCSASFERLSV